RQMAPVGRHEVVGVDAPDGHREIVSPAVSHHPHALHGEEHGKSLARRAAESLRLDLPNDDGVGLAEHDELFAGHLSQAADGEAWAGEGMPPNDFLGQTELQAQLADLILEEVTQWLDQVESKLGWQATDIVMKLDRVGRAVGRSATFDDVGVECSLSKV